jgi:hypothetical protein
MQQQQGNDWDSSRLVAGVLLFVCRALAVTVEVFLHRVGTFGERYLGLQAAAGFLLILLYPACWPHHDARPVFVLLVMYCLALLCNRVATLRRRGEALPHSLYSGTPTLMRPLGWLKEATVKRIVEPLAAFLLGVLAMPVSEPLGGYLLLAAGGLFLTTNLAASVERRRLLDMNDAYEEQRNLMEQFRQMRRD